MAHVKSETQGEEPKGSTNSFREQLLDSLFDGVYFVDRDRRITYWNCGAEHLTGYNAGEVLGKHCFDNLLRHVDDKACHLCLEKCPLSAVLMDGQRREAEVYLRHKLGHRVPVCVRVAPVRDGDNQIVGAVEVFSDVTSKKRLERRAVEMENLAFQDDLTGLPNRRYTELQVKQSLEKLEQFGGSAGVLMMDIDYFKKVNDTYGHEAGDCALRAVGRTLAHSLRPTDMVGKWGGEEFLALVWGITGSELGEIARRCCQLVAASLVASERESFQVTISVGGTYVQPSDTPETVTHRADELLYTSKRTGRNRATVG